MPKAETLKNHLKPGTIFRRSDLKQWSKSVDRELAELFKEGTLQKVAPGIYHYPKTNAFGKEPPEEEKLIRKFLKSDKFLITTYNHFNGLGLGTTQLYNQKIVYNHARSGEYKLGNLNFLFKKKNSFPDHPTKEFIFIDLVNNLKDLAEDQSVILERVFKKVTDMNTAVFKEALIQYGSPKTRKLLAAATKTLKD
ncbi:DUF6088 family protein [Pedobacter gandavensis]|uniref:DUF6088 family protein n=1 Tax=Pedobacter gandavensis TaxID=2679963 RepID=UPI00293128D6|nr:DUF6088 family protein [Pedobacter gandavensis]